MRLLRTFAVIGAAALLALSCATTGAEGKGDQNLPTAGVGPFRKLAGDEVPGIAPFVLDDRVAIYREPAVLAPAIATDDEPTILFAVAKRMGADVIVRTRADDGRAFFGTNGDFGKTPPVVLAADVPWEGGSVNGPFVLRVNDEVLLYYAAAGGIGVARSMDGFAFRKERGPIFARDPSSSWETSEVRAPSVYVLPDGRVRMLYAAGSAIGEAESIDGVHFVRVDPDPSTPAIEPILAPAPPAAPGSLLPNERPPFDTARVGDPCAVLRTTPAGRLHVRVLYTGADAAGVTAVGFAARYGETGPLSRQTAPVYSVSAKESAPALLELPSGSYLYVQQDRRVDASLTYTAIAGAFAPGSVKLAAPAPFPESP
ncbi:MAG: hypothetical protein JWP87_1903 [Labilithrix sp.]|nr:hypothetical protein [Labilithrix sp.]